MLERPEVEERALMACVGDRYGLHIAGIEFLPLGNDSSAWTYRLVTETGAALFLKVRRGAVPAAPVAVPRYLRDSGIEQVVAPLKTRDGRLWTALEGFALVLSPYREGRSGLAGGLDARQWSRFGAVLREVHDTVPPPRLRRRIPTETFVPPWLGTVAKLEAHVLGPWGMGAAGDATAQALAGHWRERSGQIRRLAGRAAELGAALRARDPERVLCHSDIHTDNLILDPAGDLSIVDWDAPRFAPRERDLMFVVDSGVGEGVVGEREQRRFFEGYGAVELDRLALAYYRYEWVVQELGDYGERVFLRADLGEETRAAAVEAFMALFGSRSVVAAAYHSERDLPAGPSRPG